MATYRVNLDIFAGPMDLLLYLVRKEEVDIYDIPISKITDQYLQYIEMLKSLDIDLAGDFLVMAATLMHIKSAMLLPRAEPEEMGEGVLEDPRAELIRQLLEYKKFKDAANLLSDAAQQQKERHPRPDSIIEQLKPEAEPQVDIEQVSVWDLLEAFDSIMKATGGVRDISHIKDDTPIDLYQIQILGRLQAEGPMVFERLFEGKEELMVLIGLFLALLELVREELVWAEQEEGSKSIYLKALTEEAAEEAVKKAVIAFEESEKRKPKIAIKEIEAKSSPDKELGQEIERLRQGEEAEK
jgi:segregation and condensation protein A